jgi:hypothetical protein
MRRLRSGVIAAGLAGALLSGVPGTALPAHATTHSPPRPQGLPRLDTIRPAPPPTPPSIPSPGAPSGPVPGAPVPVPMPEVAPRTPPPVPMPRVLPRSLVEEVHPRLPLRPPVELR